MPLIQIAQALICHALPAHLAPGVIIFRRRGRLRDSQQQFSQRNLLYRVATQLAQMGSDKNLTQADPPAIGNRYPRLINQVKTVYQYQLLCFRLAIEIFRVDLHFPQ